MFQNRRAMGIAVVLTASVAVFVAAIAGWAIADPAGPDPAVPPVDPAVIQLRPPVSKPKLVIPGEISTDVTSDIALTKLAGESRCLADAVYYEARGESEAGQIAVAEVILNRLADGGHGNTICKVVYEGFDQTFCQFTFVCDGSLDRPKTPEPWRAAQVLAAQLLAGQIHLPDQTDGATSYHSASVHEKLDSKMIRVAQIGNHVFYKQPPIGPSALNAAFRGTLQ
jgi:spore germination cell wall hydrolase CwlJ-like protein